jgi:CheY-like chemotaxis protein
LGFLYCTIGKLAEAHEHLDRAQALFTSLKDTVHLAQVDETRARVMLADGRVVDAEKLLSVAVRALENGGEQSLLAEALSTQGIALARLRDFDKAQITLQRAIDVAEQAGDAESAGQATVLMIEQLGDYLSNDDLTATVDHAWDLLKNTQDISTLKRLTNCTRRVLLLIHRSVRFPGSVDWTNFSFKDEVQRYEAHLIRLALQDSGGKVTQAAQLLGLPGHQNLLCMLDTRHKDLLDARLPKRSRKSIIRHRDLVGRSPKKRSRKAQTLKILHVEDDDVVAGMVKETLAHEGWEVETCSDGTTAMSKIASSTRYDLLLLDYDLPGANGMQLVQQARSLAYRQRMPIIILSGSLDETSASLLERTRFLVNRRTSQQSPKQSRASCEPLKTNSLERGARTSKKVHDGIDFGCTVIRRLREFAAQVLQGTQDGESYHFLTAMTLSQVSVQFRGLMRPHCFR